MADDKPTAEQKRIAELEAMLAARDQADAERAEREAEAAAAVQAAAPQSTTVPGGRYLVNDILMDAEGKPVKE